MSPSEPEDYNSVAMANHSSHSRTEHSAPKLLERWRVLRQTLARAGSENDLAGVAEALVEAGELRALLLALDPLSTLDRHGAVAAADVAAAQDPGRRTLWRLVLAGELLDRGEEGAARDLVRSLDEPYRVPSDADDAVSTILPSLLGLEPELGVRLAGWGVYFSEALVILSAREPEARVVEAARRFEEAAAELPWEHSMVRGACSARRWQLALTLASVIDRPRVTPTGSDPRFHEPEWRRRSALATIGSARLKAGDPDGAIEAWRQTGVGAIVGSGLKDMVDAGYTEEVARVLESMESEERAQAEESLKGSSFEDPSPWSKALEAARGERREEALRRLAEADAALASESGSLERLVGTLQAVRVLALVGNREAARERARTLLGSLPGDGVPEAGPAETPYLESTLAQLGMAAGEDLGDAVGRILQAAGRFEDHDQTYEAIWDAVELADALNLLPELLASLPASPDDHYRARLVTNAVSCFAFAGRVEEAFAAARSLDGVDRSTAFDILAQSLRDEGRLEEAETAALEITNPTRELCALAGAYAERGDADAARRLFDLALERAGRVMEAGEALAAAAQAGLAGAIRPWLVENLDRLLGEPEEDRKGRASAARTDARDWWEDGTPPRRRYGLDHPPGVEDPQGELRAKRTLARLSPELRAKLEATAARFEEVAKRARAAGGEPSKQWRTPHERAVGEAGEARALAARGEQEAAREALDRAFEAWRSVDEHWERIKAFPDVALAAATLGDPAAVLREGLPALADRVEKPRDRTRGDWRRDLSWGLTDLGDWDSALAMAHGTAQMGTRIEALKWLALSAPLDVLTRGQEVLEDDAVRVILLARLGILDEEVRPLTGL